MEKSFRFETENAKNAKEIAQRFESNARNALKTRVEKKRCKNTLPENRTRVTRVRAWRHDHYTVAGVEAR